eukprot:gene17806-23416_t
MTYRAAVSITNGTLNYGTSTTDTNEVDCARRDVQIVKSTREIIDFDIAVSIPVSEGNQPLNDSGTCTVYVSTQQHFCAGYKVQKF